MIYRKQLKPLVSVIIPVFNGSVFLIQAVQSVLKSTFKNYEILLIDDGSTDKSKEICHFLEKKHKKVRFYSFSKNKGLGRVLNFALKKAQGKYIARLNQDDVMSKDRLKIQVDFLNKNPQIVAVGSYIKVFKNKTNKYRLIKFLKNDIQIKKVWYFISPFSDPSVMYRKNIVLKVGGYDQSMWPADDVHLWYRIGQEGKLANIKKPLTYVRWHKQAASFKYFKKVTLSTYKVHLWFDKHIARVSIWIRLFWLVQLVSGLIFPAEFNWSIYCFLKKILKPRKIVNKVILHPIKANFSGV